LPYQGNVTQLVHVPAYVADANLEPFSTDDELYLSERHGELAVLLETRFTGSARGSVEADWPVDDPRPVAYLWRWGAGEVLYLTLGHCRGHYDMQPAVEWYPHVQRGSWQVSAFHELLRRGLSWAINGGWPQV
jgi:type 1 glutamine amidotransferase